MLNIRQSDIARKLNVSRITVSKALRDHPDISPEMKEKVIRTAKKMGYVPNLIATQLNSRRTFTIGVVIPDLENSFFAHVVDSIIDCATERKYHIILTVSREKELSEQQNIENLLGMRVDGLLVCLSQESKEFEIFDRLRKIKIPVVFFDRVPGRKGFPVVTFDDTNGALEAIDIVINNGYSRIAHFAGFSTISIGKKRADGYKTALNKHGLQVRSDWVIEGGFELKDGYDSFTQLYRLGDLPEIILAVNDRVALGIYKAAAECGVEIPSDLGVLGFGFSDTTDLFQPSLSVINQDPRIMGQTAAGLLVDMIENKALSNPEDIIINEEFLWRDSIVKKERN
jgi:DNA-binding LacI/PurR family transcriptional regulator